MRKKIKLTWIKNEAQRKQSFKKRKSGLVKKVKELTTLCGVSAFIVIHGPGEDSPTVWPSPEVARLLIERFRTVPEMERCRKMVNQEAYLRERATKMREQLQKLFRRNKENVTSYVMHEFGEGKPLSQFTMSELGSVLWLLEEKMKEIKRRLEFYRQPHRYFDRDGQGGDSTSFTLPPPTTEEMTGRQEFPWEWFFGSPVGLQPMDSNGYNFLGGSSASSSGGVSGSGSRGDGGAGSSSLQAYGDFFRVGNINGGNEVNSANVGFQPYRNNPSLGFGEGVNNNNMSVNGGNNEVGLGFGSFGGRTSANLTTNIVGGITVKDLDLASQMNFGGMPNNVGSQEMGFGSALQNPSYVHNIGSGGENLGFGLQPGQENYMGRHNNSNVVFQFNYNINAGNDAGHGILGQVQENNIQGGDVTNRVLNNGYVGSEIGAPISSDFLFPGSTSNGNKNGGNDAAENSSGDFDRYWSGLF